MEKNKAPLMELLPLFLAENVPARGPEEEDIDELTYELPETGCDPALPGEGLARHTMLYVGENDNRIRLIHDGKIAWSYDTGKGWELDDIAMLLNGNVLFTHMYWCAEVTPDKKRVWYYKVPEGAEIHSMQPIGLDRVILYLSAKQPKIMIINKKTNEVEYERNVPYDPEMNVHGQSRRMRLTDDNTIVIGFMDLHKVVEYDLELNEIWSYETERPWSVERLANGNTLITEEALGKVIEVNKQGEIVWEFSHSEIPAEYGFMGSQGCTRLSNGNTILCSMGDNGKLPQMIEVTPDKKVVWVVEDWKNLGPCTWVQLLTEPVAASYYKENIL